MHAVCTVQGSGVATPGPTRAQALAKLLCALAGKLLNSRLKYFL